jgi:hypothetical protein
LPGGYDAFRPLVFAATGLAPLLSSPRGALQLQVAFGPAHPLHSVAQTLTARRRSTLPRDVSR